jgi:lipopolysaccharide export LptBFGC system permease protein LptF
MSIKVMLRTAVAFAVPFTGTSTGVVEFVAFDGSVMLYKILSQSISS